MHSRMTSLLRIGRSALMHPATGSCLGSVPQVPITGATQCHSIVQGCAAATACHDLHSHAGLQATAGRQTCDGSSAAACATLSHRHFSMPTSGPTFTTVYGGVDMPSRRNALLYELRYINDLVLDQLDRGTPLGVLRSCGPAVTCACSTCGCACVTPRHRSMLRAGRCQTSPVGSEARVALHRSRGG